MTTTPIIPSPAQVSVGNFEVELEELVSMSKDHNVNALEQCGGASILWAFLVSYIIDVEIIYFANIIRWLLRQVEGLAKLLKSSPERGIYGNDADLLNRRNAFGTNTYPRKKGRSFFVRR